MLERNQETYPCLEATCLPLSENWCPAMTASSSSLDKWTSGRGWVLWAASLLHRFASPVSSAELLRTGLSCFGPTVYCGAGGPHWWRGARQNLRSWDLTFPLADVLMEPATSLSAGLRFLSPWLQSPLNATPTCVGGSCPTKQVKPVVRCPPSFKSTQLSSSSCRWGWASPSRAIWLLYRFVSNC